MSHILIVEDHRDFLKAVKGFIINTGIDANILEASNGEEGIAIACDKKPEVVIMDLHLGQGINGLEAASQIKHKIPGCGIIILTMYAMDGMKEICKARNFNRFIDKNDLGHSLIPAIKTLLAGKRGLTT